MSSNRNSVSEPMTALPKFIGLQFVVRCKRWLGRHELWFRGASRSIRKLFDAEVDETDALEWRIEHECERSHKSTDAGG